MLINRRTFNVRPGCMEEIIQLVKDIGRDVGSLPSGARETRLSTALFGPFDVLVTEVEFENMEQYQQYWNEAFSHPAATKFFETWDKLIAGGGTNEIWEVR